MSRHETDAVSLVLGTLFCLLALAVLLDGVPGLSLQARWVVPVALLAAGTAGLLAGLRRVRDGE